MKRYTLDRIDEGQFVFLEFPNEVNQLVIPREKINVELSEGDIVDINKTDIGYFIEIRKEEVDKMQEKVNSLLEKLKNKNN